MNEDLVIDLGDAKDETKQTDIGLFPDGGDPPRDVQEV